MPATASHATERVAAPTQLRRTAQYGPVVLLTLGILAVAQPSILGESRLTIALGLSIAALGLVLLVDVSKARWLRSSTAVILLLMASLAWVLFTAGGYGAPIEPIIVGAVGMMLALVAAAFVFSDRRRALGFARVFLISIALLSGSSIVTALSVAAGAGVAFFTFPVDPLTTATLYFPFTPTISGQSVFGVYLPRFAGIGREAGWMSMYAAAAWFLWPLAFPRKAGLNVLRVLLIGGVLTPISTAGFGVFVVVAAISFISDAAGKPSVARTTFRAMVGAAAVALAVWIALYAPVLGLESKATQNSLSLDERTAVTESGLAALANLSLGEPSAARVANINIIASTTENGWPYVVLTILCLVLPLAFTNWRASAPAVLVVFLTLLTSQPPAGAVGAYMIVMLACALSDERSRNILWRSDAA